MRWFSKADAGPRGFRSVDARQRGTRARELVTHAATALALAVVGPGSPMTDRDVVGAGPCKAAQSAFRKLLRFWRWPPTWRSGSRCNLLSDPVSSRCGSPTSFGHSESERREVYYQALLRYIGCNADTYILSALFGDEMAFRRDIARVDLANDAEVLRVVARAMPRSHPEAGWLKSAGAVLRGLARAKSVSVPVLAGHCEVGGARCGAARTRRRRRRTISASSTSAGTGAACRRSQGRRRVASRPHRHPCSGRDCAR